MIDWDDMAKDIVDTVKEAVKKDLKGQPYLCECSGCGESLIHVVNVDYDGDLNMTVNPCETCLKEARGEQS